MKRTAIACILSVLAATGLTCADGPQVAPPAASEETLALVALDLDELELAAPASHLEVRVGDEAIVVPLADRRRLADGHATWVVEGAAPLDVQVGLSGGPAEVQPASLLLRAPAPAEAGRLVVRVEQRQLRVSLERAARLSGQTRLAVDFRDPARAPVDIALSPTLPVAELAALLADPQVVSVAPWTPEPSDVDTLGALVRAGVAGMADGGAADPGAPEVAALEAGSDGGLAVEAAIEPAVEPADHDLILYYSYCGSGRPSPEQAWVIPLADGELAGRTDRMGLVVIPGLGAASADFGPDSRLRERGLDFHGESAAAREASLAALSAGDAQDALTALLDLQRAPLEEARPALMALLDSAVPHLRLNAALALSRLGALDALVDDQVRRLATAAGDAEALRAVTILGALRDERAVPALLDAMADGPSWRQPQVAWALGMIGDPRAVPALARAAEDGRSVMRKDVALALGRIGGEAAADALGKLSADDVPAVRERAYEALAIAQAPRR